MSTRYRIATDNEWLRPVMKGYKLRCCDCGLVHTVNFKIAVTPRRHRQGWQDTPKLHVLFQPSRDKEATRTARRAKQYAGLKLPDRITKR